jgi:RNA polymerase subunit RPABC4/transcription elongation factor Spt4
MEWPGGSWEATARIAAAIVGIYLAILWLSIVVWTYRDIRDRSRDLLFQVVAVLISLMFPFISLPVYLIIRPRETLAEAYDRTLEEETLLQELEDRSACPSCRRRVENDFILCPYCQTQLKQPCENCHRPLLYSWAVCPYCGRQLPEYLEETTAAEPSVMESAVPSATVSPTRAAPEEVRAAAVTDDNPTVAAQTEQPRRGQAEAVETPQRREAGTSEPSVEST